MRSASDLMGLPVLDLQTGKEIGKLNGILIDRTSRRIGAFEANTGLLHRAAFIRWQDVQNLGPDALTVPSHENLVHRGDADPEGAFQATFVGLPVFTTNGEKLGEIVDYQVDTSTGNLAGFDVQVANASHGFFGIGKTPNFFIPIPQVDTLGNESLIVPDNVRESLHDAGHETPSPAPQ